MVAKRGVLRRMRAAVGCAIALLLFANWNSFAAELPPPQGSAIFTAAGEIGNWNRGAFDDTRDSFYKHHDISFDKAMQFNRAMLSGLEQANVKAKPQLETLGEFRGPRLNAVLKALGARDVSKIRFLALDGFAVEIDAASLASKEWILALSLNGKPLAIGDQGPI